jgi:glutamyl-tRNA synthetase
MTVVTRFAPSPTGFLHIGGARTALFNWLFAKHHGGTFLLRIEDTDRARSTQEAIDAILDGMKWLGLDWDGEPVFQFARADRHKEVADAMVASGHAFACYTTPEELDTFRKENPNAKFRSPWRNGGTPPAGAKAVIRLKAPLEGETTIEDKVQGTVTVKNSELDDMILLRSDGTPTYMLAVVVDDHDMGVTQIIRGDDHLTNSFRQLMIYQAMGWTAPDFAHIPLIHGADGAKLSKRHGALGVEAYRDMGYLPEALRNYLLRLGWSHGDEEIISTEQAIEWFGLDAAGKSPSRFDFTKLENLNGHYIREADDAYLTGLVIERLGNVDELGKARLLKGMGGLKARAKTLVDLAESAALYVVSSPLSLDDKAKALLDKGGRDILRDMLPQLESLGDWGHQAIEQLCREVAENKGQKLGNIAQPLRAALSGKTISPGVFEVMEILDKEESLNRIRAVC